MGACIEKYDINTLPVISIAAIITHALRKLLFALLKPFWAICMNSSRQARVKQPHTVSMATGSTLTIASTHQGVSCAHSDFWLSRERKQQTYDAMPIICMKSLKTILQGFCENFLSSSHTQQSPNTNAQMIALKAKIFSIIVIFYLDIIILNFSSSIIVLFEKARILV